MDKNTFTALLDFNNSQSILENIPTTTIFKIKDCFAYKEDFQQKRFARFVEKTKQSVFNILKEKSGSYKDISNFNELIQQLLTIDVMQEYAHAVEKAPTDYIAPDFIEQLKEHIENTKTIDKNSTLLFLKKTYPIGLSRPLPIIERMLQFVIEPNNKILSPNLTEMIDSQCKVVCVDMIRNKSFTDNVNQDNYFQHTPNDILESIQFFEQVLNGVFAYINELFGFNMTMFANCDEELIKKAKHEMTKLLDDCQKEVEELNDFIENQNKEIESLKRQLAEATKPKQKDEKDKKIEKLLNDINSIERSKNKLQKNYNNLSQKYEALIEKTKEIENSTQTVPEEVEDKPQKQLDPNGVYLFIGGGNKPDFKILVKETFPNAIFTDSNLSLNKRKIDMAVCLTSYVSHTTYNYLKEECRINNVPFLHCKFMNFDIIKNEMLSLLNS